MRTLKNCRSHAKEPHAAKGYRLDTQFCARNIFLLRKVKNKNVEKNLYFNAYSAMATQYNIINVHAILLFLHYEKL